MRFTIEETQEHEEVKYVRRSRLRLHQGVDSGAGRVVFDPPVRMATSVPNAATSEESGAQVS